MYLLEWGHILKVLHIFSLINDILTIPLSTKRRTDNCEWWSDKEKAA